MTLYYSNTTNTTATNIGNAVVSTQSALTFFASLPFLLAIVQACSVGMAFSGLLKFYHTVQEELQWCQPFSKFLCIKGVVFMTFWQGLLISILVHVHSNDTQDDDDDDDPATTSRTVQNVLICLEMLFFSVAHWCTFPAEEWEKDYRPRSHAKPGMGFQDFVSDVSVIMEHRNAAKKNRKQQRQQRRQQSLHSEEDSESVVLVEEENKICSPLEVDGPPGQP
eukprot:CAMPEP_0116844650 /NCGR_PEP_ID=MMETSP0418-20121206/12816_1 /TAXON_ID=1158023 /ORGANISM="Astrosyne radiata, Strain 13vi08-1A" /LENGTH=221 /DNA_ID=CAMNT_0004475647 /DNA_START=244 /DNA_END=909 /DNA_ORIENTATION=+